MSPVTEHATAWARLMARAEQQLGTFTTKQAEACGVPRQTLAVLVERRRIIRFHRGVFGIAGMADSWQRRAMVALHRAGDAGVLCDEAAAYVHGLLDIRRPSICVLFVRGRQRDIGPVRRRTTERLPDHHVCVRKPFRLTSVPRTLRDLSAVRGERWTERALYDACRRGLTDIASVRSCLDDFARNPRAIGTVVQRYEATFEDARSVMEVEGLVAIREAGLPTPVVNLRVRVGTGVRYIDLAWPMVKVAVEIDGRSTHSLPFDVAADRARQAELEALGWTVIRIPAHWLAGDAGRAIRRIRRALLNAGHPAVR